MILYKMMLVTLECPVVEEINLLYEKLKRGSHGEAAQALLRSYHFQIISMLNDGNAWESAQKIDELQERLRETLCALAGE